VAACPVFTELSQQDSGRPVHSGCPQLVATIENAVSDGVVPVGAGVDPIEVDS
jgi:hypothetical protein